VVAEPEFNHWPALSGETRWLNQFGVAWVPMDLHKTYHQWSLTSRI